MQRPSREGPEMPSQEQAQHRFRPRAGALAEGALQIGFTDRLVLEQPRYEPSLIARGRHIHRRPAQRSL